MLYCHPLRCCVDCGFFCLCLTLGGILGGSERARDEVIAGAEGNNHPWGYGKSDSCVGCKGLLQPWGAAKGANSVVELGDTQNKRAGMKAAMHGAALTNLVPLTILILFSLSGESPAVALRIKHHLSGPLRSSDVPGTGQGNCEGSFSEGAHNLLSATPFAAGWPWPPAIHSVVDFLPISENRGKSMRLCQIILNCVLGRELKKHIKDIPDQ